MQLYLIRGLPGSGKSTLAYTVSAGSGAPVYEADQHFETSSGYQFDPARLTAAHMECLGRARVRLVYGQRVVVSNTFSCRWEMEPYLRAAKANSARVTVIDLFDAGLDDAALAARCKHGVPVERIADMRARWEHNWGEGDPRHPRQRE